MSADLDWTAALGEAVVADQGEVLQAVQAFRRKAQAAGNLKSDSKQTVVIEKEVITIVQTDPQVIYVPQYDPYAVVVAGYPYWGYYPYGYPVYYYPYAPGAAFAAGLIWGAAIGAIWNGGHYVNHYGGNNTINIDRNTNINTGDRNRPSTRPTEGRGSGSSQWKPNKQPGQVSRTVGATPPARAGDRAGAGSGGGGLSGRQGAARPSTGAGGGGSRGARRRERGFRRLRLRPADADEQLARCVEPEFRGTFVDVRTRRWWRARRRRRTSLGDRDEARSGNRHGDEQDAPCHPRCRGAGASSLLASLLQPLAAQAAEQRTFAAPEAAVEALIAALKANDEAALVALVGDKHKEPGRQRRCRLRQRQAQRGCGPARNVPRARRQRRRSRECS